MNQWPFDVGGSCLPLENLKDETTGQLKININYLWQIIRNGGHQPEEVAAESRSNHICPTRKF
jgi:hypothetical protein